MSESREIHYNPHLSSASYGVDPFASPPEPLRGYVAEAAAASAQGTGRRRNEDAYLCALPLLAVADGVGGQHAGHLASWLAIGALAGRRAGGPAEELREAFEEANTAIRSLGHDQPYLGAATTLTCVRFVPGGMWLSHLGDSRAHRVRGGEIEQLSCDHSLVAELRRSGAITAEQASRHPMRSAITRGLGVYSEAGPDLLRVELAPRDAVLLCTDGLSKTVAAAEVIAELPSLARSWLRSTG